MLSDKRRYAVVVVYRCCYCRGLSLSSAPDKTPLSKKRFTLLKLDLHLLTFTSWRSHTALMISFWNFRLGDRTLTVSYAEPKQSEMNQDQVKSVYVGGLTAAATKESLQAFFEGLDNIGEVIGFTFA